MAKKTKATNRLLERLRENLIQLTAACPFHVSNPTDCPLFPLRQLEPPERLEFINGLSEADLSYLANYHSVCLRIQSRAKPGG